MSSQPRVAVVRQFRETGGMPESVLKGLRALGADATMVYYARALDPMKEALRGPAAGFVYEMATEALRPLADAMFIAEIARLRPDLVLIFKNDGLSTATYRALKLATSGVIAVFHPDDPFNVGRRVWFKRRGGPAHRRSRVAMREADVYLTWSDDLMRRARAEGARRVEFMPFGCDPELHPRVDLAEVPDELKADVVFIGSWDPERERWLRALATLDDVDFALWGGLWDTHCKDATLRRAWRGRPLVGREMSQAVAGGKIHVNILRRQNKRAHNMRTFEIPCAGGFMLHERSAEAARIFSPGEACDDFGTPEELCDKVRHYLAAPDERARIAEAGYRRAHEYTYTDWARRVLELTLG